MFNVNLIFDPGIQIEKDAHLDSTLLVEHKTDSPEIKENKVKKNKSINNKNNSESFLNIIFIGIFIFIVSSIFYGLYNQKNIIQSSIPFEQIQEKILILISSDSKSDNYNLNKINFNNGNVYLGASYLGIPTRDKLSTIFDYHNVTTYISDSTINFKISRIGKSYISNKSKAVDLNKIIDLILINPNLRFTYDDSKVRVQGNPDNIVPFLIQLFDLEEFTSLNCSLEFSDIITIYIN